MSDDLEARLYGAPSTAVVDTRREFMVGVYGWMAAALIVTGAIAWITANSPTMLRTIYMTPGASFILIGGLIAMSLTLQSRVLKLPLGVATALYVTDSVVNGIALSYVFLLYTSSSVAATFFVTAGTFAGMSIYGMTTKKDLTTIGGYAIMATWGLFLASIVNVFFAGSPSLYWLITYAGVVVFVILIAYDSQKLLAIADQSGSMEAGTRQKYLILAAFLLYIDFVALFIYLLRLLGARRSD